MLWISIGWSRRTAASRTKVERKFELIGQAPVMQQLKQLIETAGPTNSRVLIGGENGTGKELVARAIHQA